MVTYTCCRGARESTAQTHDWECPLHPRNAKTFADYQQRIGAPLTFFAQVAANAYAAAATRDDVSHLDAMRVALQAVEDAMQHKDPNAELRGRPLADGPA